MAAVTLRPGQTPQLAYALSKTKLNLTSKEYGWPGHVIPSRLVERVLNEQVKPIVMKEMRSVDSTQNPELGWLEHLAGRAATISRTRSAEAMKRRLYDVLHQKSTVTYAEMVDNWCLAAGLHLDHDTGLPTLPGNKQDALELIYRRGKAVEKGLTKFDCLPLIPPLIDLCYAIIKSPDQLAELQDDAPFDCLRPWGSEGVVALRDAA